MIKYHNIINYLKHYKQNLGTKIFLVVQQVLTLSKDSLCKIGIYT